MIVVFGSLNIDMVMPVNKIPEPGETVLCPDYQLFPGGKGANQAAAAAKAGARVKMYGCVGEDTFGQQVTQALDECGVDVSGVEKTDSSTGCATICVDPNGENMITVASGANMKALSSLVPAKDLSEKTTLILQMEVPREQNWDLVRRAKKKGARVILNLAPAAEIPLDILPLLDVLVLNEGEATWLAEHLGFDGTYPRAVSRRLTEMFGLVSIVTLGEKGAYATSPDGHCHVEAMSIEAIDTTGAGDAFVGALAQSLDAGFNLSDALHRASVASGLACQVAGALPSLPSAAEIDQAQKLIDTPKMVA